MRPLIRLLFPEPLPLWPTTDGRAVLLSRAPIFAELWHGGRILLCVVPAGFVFDGVSRPGWAAGWVKRWGTAVEEALLHDFLLWQMQRGRLGRPKFLVDLMFLLALVSGGHSFLRSMLMFLAVRTRRAPAPQTEADPA